MPKNTALGFVVVVVVVVVVFLWRLNAERGKRLLFFFSGSLAFRGGSIHFLWRRKGCVTFQTSG